MRGSFPTAAPVERAMDNLGLEKNVNELPPSKGVEALESLSRVQEEGAELSAEPLVSAGKRMPSRFMAASGLKTPVESPIQIALPAQSKERMDHLLAYVDSISSTPGKVQWKDDLNSRKRLIAFNVDVNRFSDLQNELQSFGYVKAWNIDELRKGKFEGMVNRAYKTELERELKENAVLEKLAESEDRQVASRDKLDRGVGKQSSEVADAADAAKTLEPAKPDGEPSAQLQSTGTPGSVARLSRSRAGSQSDRRRSTSRETQRLNKEVVSRALGVGTESEHSPEKDQGEIDQKKQLSEPSKAEAVKDGRISGNEFALGDPSSSSRASGRTVQQATPLSPKPGEDDAKAPFPAKKMKRAPVTRGVLELKESRLLVREEDNEKDELGESKRKLPGKPNGKNGAELLHGKDPEKKSLPRSPELGREDKYLPRTFKVDSKTLPSETFRVEILIDLK